MYFWRLVRLFLYSNKVCSSRLLVFFTNGISDLPLSAVVIVVVVPLEYTSLTGSALRHTCLSAAIKSGLKPPPASSNSVWQTSLGRKNSKFHAWCRRSEPGNVKDFLRVLDSKPTAQVLAAAAPLYWHPLSYDLRGVWSTYCMLQHIVAYVEELPSALGLSGQALNKGVDYTRYLVTNLHPCCQYKFHLISSKIILRVPAKTVATAAAHHLFP